MQMLPSTQLTGTISCPVFGSYRLCLQFYEDLKLTAIYILNLYYQPNLNPSTN
jgi:hypothetical protein